MNYKIKKTFKKIGLYEFICRNFLQKRKFIIEPFVYVDKKGNITKEITDIIRWLEKFEIETQCIEFAEAKFWEYARKKYAFHDAIWIF